MHHKRDENFLSQCYRKQLGWQTFIYFRPRCIYALLDFNFSLIHQGPMPLLALNWISTASWVNAEITLLIMAIDRFIAVMYPLNQAKAFRNTKRTVSMSWLVAAILSTVQSLFFIYIWEDTVFTDTMYPMIVLPWIPSFILYSILIHRLWRRSRENISANQNHRNQQKAFRKVVNMLIIVLSTNIASRIAKVMVIYQSETQRDYLTVFTTFISLLDSSFSPFVYLLMSEQFKKALQRILPFTGCGCLTIPLHNVEMVDREQPSQPVVVIGINSVEPQR